MDEVYEHILLVKPEVNVFRIPPRQTNRAVRAADWKLDAPDWTGRLRIISRKGDDSCYLKLEDGTSGELFAKSKVASYPGIAVESVSDSSRYFVVRIEDDNGRSAFIGMGFNDRADSFDFNVTLQDHFKWVRQSQQQAVEPPAPKLDLGFRQGETITIDIGKLQKDKGEGGTPKKIQRPVGGRLPPPPGSSSIPFIAPPPPRSPHRGRPVPFQPPPQQKAAPFQPPPQQRAATGGAGLADLLGDLDIAAPPPGAPNKPDPVSNLLDLSDFGAAHSDDPSTGAPPTGAPSTGPSNPFGEFSTSDWSTSSNTGTTAGGQTATQDPWGAF